MSDNDDVVNIKGLDQLIKSLKVNPPLARVGILGTKNYREGKNNSNATIGAAHEYGTSTLPMRSFLRVPISEHLQAKMEQSGALDKQTLDKVIKDGSVIPWLTKVAILAQSIVLEAFDTGGFGKWKPSNMTRKKTKQTLVETHQLRDSITYEVKE